MFLGSYTPSFDRLSRRVALPKKIRDYLATSEVILSFGFEKCLFGFDTKAWQNQADKQLSQPLTERGPRNLRRFIFANATYVLLDDQGRFVIPDSLLKFAKIRRPIIVGAGDHFEIWDARLWVKELTRLKHSQK